MSHATRCYFPPRRLFIPWKDRMWNAGSRLHLTRQIEGSLKRLKTDYIDVYHMHGFDALTPIEETLATLDNAVRQGKIRYIAASNFSGWHLEKSLGVSRQYGWSRYVAHQVYYSLVGRDYEWELMPLGLAEGVGALVWSPLGWGRLTGKIRRGQPLPEVSRLHKTAESGPQVPDEHLYKVIDALDALATKTGRSVPQLALNWLLRKPSVSSVIIGARNVPQLKENLAATSFELTLEQVAQLDQVPAKRRCRSSSTREIPGRLARAEVRPGRVRQNDRDSHGALAHWWRPGRLYFCS